MKRTRSWAAAVLVVSAIAGYFTLRNNAAPVSTDTLPQSETITPVIKITDTPVVTDTPAYEGCSYMWATRDAPELTRKIDDAIRAINPEAHANASLFGEDCVYADGHSTFGAMGTDFYIRVPVEDFSTEEGFGNLMKQALDFVIALPEDEIQGGKGFVEFSFIRGEVEQITLRVEINDYLNDASGMAGAELFQKFYTPSPPLITPIPATPTPTS